MRKYFRGIKEDGVMELSNEDALKLMFEAIDKADAQDQFDFKRTTVMSSHIERIKHLADVARGGR